MNAENAAKKARIIKSKFGGTLRDGRRFRAGEIVVYFPRMDFEGKTESGKQFRNIYVKLEDMHNYSDLDLARRELMKRYNLTEEELKMCGRPKVTWRR